LASGLRVNTASDDAAGLAVAQSLRVDSRVFSQGVRNLNDAQSYLNIAGSAMAELSSVLARVRELAEQAANGTMTSVQRAALNQEAQALRNEYIRIGATVSFNGKTLLNDPSSSLDVQAGYNAIQLGGVTLRTGGIGDGTFQAGISYATGSLPFDMEIADLNGDSYEDIVTADFISSSVSILLGNSDGSFRARTAISTGAFPQNPLLIDINGDTHVDVLVAEQVGSTVGILLGNGDGTFKAKNSISTQSATFDVIAVDVNGDNRLDLVAADQGSASVSILLGNGNGTFKFRTTFATDISPERVISADFNGDGKLDLATSDSSGVGVSVLLGNGNGTFKAKLAFATGANVKSVVSSDLNGDGVLDLVTGDNGVGTISVLFGNGNGTFKARTAYTVGSVSSIFLSDINDDNVLDVLAGNSYLFGNGNGTFRAPTTISTALVPTGIADFNDDGIKDLLSAGAAEVGVFFGNGNSYGVLSTFSLLTQESALSTLTQISAASSSLSLSLGAVGAQQSRLHSALSHLSISQQGYTEAASQILDVDVATESSQLTRLSILQSASSAILAQANQLPALALNLLR